MHRALRPVGWLVLLSTLLGLACNMQQTPPPPPSPTPPPRFCREFVGIPDPPQPTAVVAYQQAIADFLSEGGSPDALETLLRRWGVIDDNRGTVNADYDFNSDGYRDVVISIRYPETTTLQPPGEMLVFGCQGPSGRYGVLHGLASAPEASTSFPQIGYLGDVTGDGRPEIFFYTERCTPVVCLQEPFILTWDPAADAFRTIHEQFTSLYHFTDDAGNILPGFPAAEFRFEDLTGDGPMEFIIEEWHTSSAMREAGPIRQVRYTWTWNGSEYANPTRLASPSAFRIHAVREGDWLLQAGDVEEAIRAYNKTLTSRELVSWGGVNYSPENVAFEESMLDSYTRYRLVIAHAAARDGEARSELSTMQQLLPYTPGNVPSYYTRLAEIFLETFFSTGNNADPLSSACATIRDAAGRFFPESYTFLGDRAYFGSALDAYSVQDLCPF